MSSVPESSAGPVTSALALHAYSYFSARESPDGTLVHSGPKNGEGYQYVAPDGTRYQRNWSYGRAGNPTGIIGHGLTGPVVNGTQVVALTVINHASRTYSQERTEYSLTDGANAPKSPALGLASSPSEVQQALQNGQVTRMGTTTVDGTTTIALSVPARGFHFTLHVDAQTYQPLRTVTVVDGSAPYVADWMPATPENIAKAKDDYSIPAGYTKVDSAL